MKPEQLADHLKATVGVPYDESLLGYRPEAQEQINEVGVRLETLIRHILDFPADFKDALEKEDYKGPYAFAHQALLIEDRPTTKSSRKDGRVEGRVVSFVQAADFLLPVPNEVAAQALTPEELAATGALTEKITIGYLKRVYDYEDGTAEVRYEIKSETTMESENSTDVDRSQTDPIFAVEDFKVIEITDDAILDVFDMYLAWLLHPDNLKLQRAVAEGWEEEEGERLARALAIQRIGLRSAQETLDGFDIERLEAVVAGLEAEAALAQSA